MYAIEFETIPENGKIVLPTEYRNIKDEIKVIVFTKNYKEENPAKERVKLNAVKLHTKGFKFDRDEANER